MSAQQLRAWLQLPSLLFALWRACAQLRELIGRQNLLAMQWQQARGPDLKARAALRCADNSIRICEYRSYIRALRAAINERREGRLEQPAGKGAHALH